MSSIKANRRIRYIYPNTRPLPLRLPVVQAGTFALLVPTLAYLKLPQWQCPSNIVNQCLYGIIFCVLPFTNTMYIVNCTLYIVYCTLYTVHCALYIVHSSLYIVHCTFYTVHCTLYIVHCTLYIVHCTMYSIHCTLYIVNCIIYILNLNVN